jgi:hypothetical protein
MITDIVVTTCERLELLKRTLGHIWERTVTPYRLQVIDDASTEGNADYLTGLVAEGRIGRAHLHRRRKGIPFHLRSLVKVTDSDPIVFTDDDVLCPRLDPDWLARGLEAMARFPRMGMLALNNPHCNVGGKRGETMPGDPVTLCRNVPGTFVFARRAVLEGFQPPDGTQSAVKWMCLEAAKLGWQIGYLTHVYCQHIGTVSVRNQKDLSREIALVQPTNPDTLEPPDAYKG